MSFSTHLNALRSKKCTTLVYRVMCVVVFHVNSNIDLVHLHDIVFLERPEKHIYHVEHAFTVLLKAEVVLVLKKYCHITDAVSSLKIQIWLQ